MGPTASGKTMLACNLASATRGEIISADSRQVYRHMDIGTGKDLEEYKINDVPIPYHLIDIKEPGYKYNIAEFQANFIAAFDQIIDRNNLPILCGGSGLYLETALRGNSFLGIPSYEELWSRLKAVSDEVLEAEYRSIDSGIQSKLNALTRPRKIRAIEIALYLNEHPNWLPSKLPDLKPLIIGVNIERELRRNKITNRLSQRMNNGLIEEVELLLENGLSHADLDYYGLEYKWIGKYLNGEVSKRILFESLNTAIHQFAKRQMTWFRRMEKNGYPIQWIDAAMPLADKLAHIQTMLKQ
ncbi:MAG: tRNA dimethylallyltransferase [Crocinitomix sp.]